MKFAIVLLALVTSCWSLHGQQLQFGPPSEVPHVQANIKSSPGVAEGRYYVLYDDYGPTFGFTINMDSYLKIYSADRGNLIRSVHLNPLVSTPGSIFFMNVMLWKGHILGLYLIKHPNARHFPIYGQLFSLDGKPEGNSKVVGTFERPSHPILAPDFPPLQFGFDSDSTHLALLSVPREASDNAAFTVLDTSLAIVRKVSCSLPFTASRAGLAAFRPQGDTLYVLAAESVHRVTSYTLFAVKGDGGSVARIPLWLNGNTMLDALLTTDKSGDVVVTGTYFHGDKPARRPATNGVFALKVRGGKLVSKDVREFPAEMVGELAGRKAAKKEKGLEDETVMNRIIPAADGGFAAFGQAEHITEVTEGVMIRGNYEVYGNVIFYKIDAEGKISWCKGLKREQTHNLLYETSDGPVYGYACPEGIRMVYDGKNAGQGYKKGIYVDTYDAHGQRKSHFYAIPRSFAVGTEFIWRTAQLTDPHHLSVVWFEPGKKKMGVLKVPLP